MATLTLQDNVDFTPVAADVGGDECPQGVRAGGWGLPVVLYVQNDDAASTDVTVGGKTETVAAGEKALIPVFGIYLEAEKSVTYTNVTSVTVAAVRLHGE